MKTAVIIKGNPRYEEQAKKIYKDLKKFLSASGYHTSFVEGEEYTLPVNADVWIGYSRGIGRLQFASDDTLTIGIGGEWPRCVNHSLDNVAKKTNHLKTKPNEYHFILTEKMKLSLSDYLSDSKE